MPVQPSRSTPLPQPPAPPVKGLGGDQRPLTRSEVEAIRSELTRQLESVKGRRDAAIAELRALRAADQPGSPGAQIRQIRSLEQLIEQYDARILQIESEFADVGRRVTESMMLTPPPTQPPFSPADMPPGAITAIAIVFTVVFLGPISLAPSRFIWKRATASRPAGPTWDSSQRLDRLEHSLDSIAVEVERISEGQRFVTRLLTESPNFGALGAKRPGESVMARQEMKVPPDEP